MRAEATQPALGAGPEGPGGHGAGSWVSRIFPVWHRTSRPCLTRNAPFPPRNGDGAAGAGAAPLGLRGRARWGRGAPPRPGLLRTPQRLISDPLAISAVANENCPAPGAAQATPHPQTPGWGRLFSNRHLLLQASSPGGSFWPRLWPLVLRLPSPRSARQKGAPFSTRRHLQITLGLLLRRQLPHPEPPTPLTETHRRDGGGAGSQECRAPGLGGGWRGLGARSASRSPARGDSPAAFPGASLSSRPPTPTPPALPPPRALPGRAAEARAPAGGVPGAAPLPARPRSPAPQPAARCAARAPGLGAGKTFPDCGCLGGGGGVLSLLGSLLPQEPAKSGEDWTRPVSAHLLLRTRAARGRTGVPGERGRARGDGGGGGAGARGWAARGRRPAPRPASPGPGCRRPARAPSELTWRSRLGAGLRSRLPLRAPGSGLALRLLLRPLLELRLLLPLRLSAVTPTPGSARRRRAAPAEGAAPPRRARSVCFPYPTDVSQNIGHMFSGNKLGTSANTLGLRWLFQLPHGRRGAGGGFTEPGPFPPKPASQHPSDLATGTSGLSAPRPSSVPISAPGKPRLLVDI